MRSKTNRATGVLLALTTTAALATSARAQSPVELEARYWSGTLDASARVSDGTIGTVLDFKKDLGLSDKGIADGRLIFHTGPRSRIRLGYLQVSYDGDATVNRTIEFSGQTYTFGTRVLTALDKKYARLGWTWQFVSTANGVFRLGTVLEIKGLSVDARLDAPNLDPPAHESHSASAVLPTLGLALDLTPHRTVALFAEASGLDAGSKGSMVDAEAGIRVTPVRGLSLIASYRILDIKLKDEPDFAKLKISGAFTGISVRF